MKGVLLMEMKNNTASGKQFVVFRVGMEEYGVDIQKISIIEKFMNIARVPSMPPFMLGVVNLRGEIIPVMDLRLRFEMEPKEADDDSRIIIFKIGEISLGMLVDMVSEVHHLEDEDVESVTSITNDRTLDYITGVGKIDGRLVTLLHVEKLLTDISTAVQ